MIHLHEIDTYNDFENPLTGDPRWQVFWQFAHGEPQEDLSIDYVKEVANVAMCKGLNETQIAEVYNALVAMYSPCCNPRDEYLKTRAQFNLSVD